MDTGAVIRRCAELGVAVEHNASPERLDLSDRDLRLAKECGCRIVINTDAHAMRVVGDWRYGIRQLRRAWLTASDVLNTLPAAEFMTALRQRIQNSIIVK
jgi:DNA polymerase (family 10)